jgi:hypothetical protein
MNIMEISVETLRNISNLGISREMPIMLDYWLESQKEGVFIGVKDQEKILVKNSEEYTSPIKQILNSVNEYIILTENSIYVVSNKIKPKKIK